MKIQSLLTKGREKKTLKLFEFKSLKLFSIYIESNDFRSVNKYKKA